VLVRRFGIVGVAVGSLLGLAVVEGALMPLMVRRYLNRIRGRGFDVKPAPIAADPLDQSADPV
jgi:hypothetical protein